MTYLYNCLKVNYCKPELNLMGYLQDPIQCITVWPGAGIQYHFAMVLIFPCWATGLHLIAKICKSHRSTCGIHSRWDPDEHQTKILADQPLVLLEYPYPPDFNFWPGLCPWPKVVQKIGSSLMLRGPLEPSGSKIT